MNLALLPSEFIGEAFDDLELELQKNETLLDIIGLSFDYYRATWINGKGTKAFSVHELLRRTNNLLERYHRTLKSRMVSKPEVAMGVWSCFFSSCKNCAVFEL